MFLQFFSAQSFIEKFIEAITSDNREVIPFRYKKRINKFFCVFRGCQSSVAQPAIYFYIRCLRRFCGIFLNRNSQTYFRMRIVFEERQYLRVAFATSKDTKQGEYGEFSFFINMHGERPVRFGFNFYPRAAGRNYFCAKKLFLFEHLLGERHSERASELGYNDALVPVYDK